MPNLQSFPAIYEEGLKRWKITCSRCNKDFVWNCPEPVIATGFASEPKDDTSTPMVFSQRCPNRLGDERESPECGAVWQIETNPEKIKNDCKNAITGIRRSPTPESDVFWTEMAWKRVDQTLDSLDKRAEYMLTTIGGLIAVNFGLLIAFDIPFFSANVAPQFLLAISAIFFSLSHFPRAKIFYPESATDVKRVYNEWLTSKLRWHKWGYALFISGLFAIGITFMIQPSGNATEPQNINGTLTINIPDLAAE